MPRRSIRSPPTASKCCAAPRRCCSARRRSAAWSTSSTRASRAASRGAGPCRGLLGYGSAANETLGQLARSMSRSVGHLVAPRRRQLDQERRSAHRRLHPRQAAARRGAAPAPTPRSARSPTSRASCPTAPAAAAEVAGALGLCRRRRSTPASRSPATPRFYGVPLRYSLDPAVEAEAPRLDVEQTRYDARVEMPLAGRFQQVRLRGGYARYHHDELERRRRGREPSFFTRGGEGRIDLVQADRAGWGGTSGVQFLRTSVAIDGEEKYPAADARQRRPACSRCRASTRARCGSRAGARFERSRLTADADDVARHSRPRAAASRPCRCRPGAAIRLVAGWKAGLNLARRSARPVDRGIVRQRPACRDAGVRGRRPRPRCRTQPWRRSEHQAHAPARSLSLHRLRQPLRQLHLPGPDRRDRGRSAGLRLSPGPRALSRVRSSRPMPGSATDRRDRLGPRGAVADATRATIKGVGPAPHIPPLRAARRGDRPSAARVDGRVEVERACGAAPHRAARNRDPGLHDGQCRGRLASARGDAPN